MSIPAAFDYHTATSVDEAIALLQQYGDEAKVLAGGHSLLPTMKMRLAQPGHLVDIGRISGLSYIREDSGAVAVGAMTRYSTIMRSDVVGKYFALLPEGTALIGDQQIRNRGTIGGSVAHSDPAADMPGMVLALRADIIVQGTEGVRIIKADDFFLNLFETALQPGEVIMEMRFAWPPAHTGSAYEKLANKTSHYAVAGGAAVVTLDTDGICISASVVIVGVSVKPSRASGVEAALVGKKLDEIVIADAASHATANLEIVSDIYGSKECRSQMASVIAKRAIARAVRRGT